LTVINLRTRSEKGIWEVKGFVISGKGNNGREEGQLLSMELIK
jgi:hypothetical protein